MKGLKKPALGIAIVLLFLIVPGLNVRLKVVHYGVEADRIDRPVSLALVTDLHSCAWGPGEQTLIDAVDAEAPDVILLGGDIFDDALPDDNTEAFLAGIAERYPCYYVTGNHEHWASEKAFSAKMSILEKYGIPRLSGEAVAVEVKGQRFTLCGVDDPRSWGEDRDNSYRIQVEQAAGMAEDGDYVVLLAHRPEYIDLYSRCGFDLVLSGHTHGGQWRIPGLVNGLFAPDQGLFPQYAGGRYDVNGTTLIVSRGLAKESTRLPRFYNRPELVIVELL